MKRVLITLCFALCACPASAQQLDATKIYLGTATVTGSGTSVVLSGLSVTGNSTLSTGTASTWLATPSVRATALGGTLTLGGTGVAGCGTPPTAANCEAPQWILATPFLEQRLSTDTSYRSQWYVGSDGGHLNAYNGGGWMPLRVSGGPVEVGGGGLHVGSTSIVDPGLGNAAIDGYIGLPGYASQTTGWRIDNLGAADFRYLYTDELHAKSFITDLEQALAGGQIISKSVAVVGADFTVPSPGSISVLTLRDLPSAPNMAVFEAGDAVRLRQFSRASGSLSITDAWGTVSSYADLAGGLQSWNFTRLLIDGGTMAAGTTIAAEAVVLDYGVSGNGFYEVNAIDGLYGVNSPYAQIVTWDGSSPAATNQTVRARFGNLLGITGTPEWGLLAGAYGAESAGRYLIFSDQHAELHNVPLTLWNGAQTVIDLNPSVPYMSMGLPAPSSFSSGDGCWSGVDAGAFKWRCGNPSSGSNFIQWDGSTGLLTLNGAIQVEGTVTDADNALALVGVAGATVVSGAARGALGLDANGNPVLPHTATPSGSGLFLGSDHLGYYASGAWKTYMTSSGGFYLGGASGALQWNGSTLTIAGTLSGNGSGITSISGGNITVGSITDTQIAANAITAAKIADGTITAAELATATITGDKIAGGTITADNIAAGTIAAVAIGAGTITAYNMAAETLTAETIAAGAITTSKIYAKAVTFDKIHVESLSAISANIGTVTAGTITGVTISGVTLYAGDDNEVMISDSGLKFKTATDYSSTANMISWDNGAIIGSGGADDTWITAPGGGGSMHINLYRGLSARIALMFGGNEFFTVSDGGWTTVNGNGLFVSNGVVEVQAHIIPHIRDMPTLGAYDNGFADLFIVPAQTTDSYYPLVMGPHDQVLAKTNGYSGSVSCGGGDTINLTIENGLITNYTCN